MAPNTASIEHPITKHCPVVTGGDLTPQLLLLTRNAFEEYFITKTVIKEDQVKLILGAFKDVHIQDWIAADHGYLLRLSFMDFMAELGLNFLPSDWAESVPITLLSMWMTQNTRFWDFAQEVCTLNIVLHDTPLHLGDVALHNQLEAGLNSSLQSECAQEELYKLPTLREWIKCVHKIDECLAVEWKRYWDIFTEESNLCANKQPALRNSQVPNHPSNNTASSLLNPKPFTHLPKLTDVKKDLLQWLKKMSQCLHDLERSDWCDLLT